MRSRTKANRFGALVVLLLLTLVTLDPAARQAISAEPAAEPAEPNAPNPDFDDPKLAGHFSGRVTGPDGQPFGGARIYVAPNEGFDNEEAVLAIQGPGPVRAKTDAEGRFEFDAPDMTRIDLDGLPSCRQCLVIAAADGYAPEWFECRGRSYSLTWGFYPVRGTDLSLRLAKDDVPMSGRLFDVKGRPLVGAHVRLTALIIPPDRDLDEYLDRRKDLFQVGCPPVGRYLARPYLLPGVSVEAQTDANGRFTLTGLGRERVASLLVSAPSVEDTYLSAMTRAGAAPNSPPTVIEERPASDTYAAGFGLKLPPGRTISGLVRDRDTRKPIAGMWVGAPFEPSQGLVSGSCRWVTDPEGRFAITGLPAFDSARDARQTLQINAVSPPGMTYDVGALEVQNDDNREIVIDCPTGIPFRLKVVDEQGQPVVAEVTYHDVHPNPYAGHWPISSDGRWPVSRAAHRSEGVYDGFVRPGPGAILVKTPGRTDLRPAHVDPKAVFAPGRSQWTAQERISAYGTQESLAIGGWHSNQYNYVAIVLVNPQPDSPPLELSAIAQKDHPRQVTLVDPDGKPVVGAVVNGHGFRLGGSGLLRAASFPLGRLNPDRSRRITFTQKERGLIGFLMARGDADTPYTVHMQPWGAAIGRVVDENGNPSKTDLSSLGDDHAETNGDPDIGIFQPLATDEDGKFRIDNLIPGQRYSAMMWRQFKYLGVAFENLTVGPGEVRDLGDIRSQSPLDMRGK